MASLNNLLNPEEGSERPRRRQAVVAMEAIRNISPPDEEIEETNGTDQYYEQTAAHPHDPHPDCPNALSCLADSEGRPQHTLPVILRCAILGSPRSRLTIREIYAAMERKYPYYKTAGPAWKQSVRHHLSLNRLFERQPRPATDPGFGSYWVVNLEAPPGTKRPRKRGRNREARERAAAIAAGAGAVSNASTSTSTRRRGASDSIAYATSGPASARYEHPPIATLRPVDSRSFSRPTAGRVRTEYEDEYEDEDEDEEMAYDTGDGDDYESEEGASPYYGGTPPHYNGGSPRYNGPSHPYASSSHPYPSVQPYYVGGVYPQYDPRSSYHPPARPVLHGAFSGYSSTNMDPRDATVERLKMEMAGLRRQSTDAVAASSRLSTQLAEIQEENMRTRDALKQTEQWLREEKKHREEVERAFQSESRKREALEQKLEAYQTKRRPPSVN